VIHKPDSRIGEAVMETLYDNLLEYYDELFPVDDKKIDFISRELYRYWTNKGLPKVLDVGCATGSIDFALIKRNFLVTGIDNNVSMIQSACRRNPEPKTKARFFCMDMLEAAKILAPASFNGVLCLGNTLVHLPGSEEIARFLRGARRLMESDGVLIVQVVNYDKILADGITQLPSIQTLRCTFARTYSLLPDGHIKFNGTVYSSNNVAVFRDEVELYPLRSKELRSLLDEEGYRDIEFFNDFDGQPFDGSSFGLVVVARS
jgi:SAM-dependent methyltransferase